MSQGSVTNLVLTPRNLPEIIEDLQRTEPQFSLEVLSQQVGLSTEQLQRLVDRELVLHPGVAHLITEHIKQFHKYRILRSPLTQQEQGELQAPPAGLLRQKWKEAAELIQQLPETNYESLSVEEKNDYLTVSSDMARFLLKFSQYSHINLFNTDQFEGVISAITRARMSNSPRKED